jgi:phosphatidylinositol kinase/protein kinase (PI-3  family)
VLHIDFGDCFEASMHREKFPEKVPFRLTRMLVKAMEVSGIEGNFRSTCTNVMHVLRVNKDSVMAMLEAFVHDPLINWRLLNATADNKVIITTMMTMLTMMTTMLMMLTIMTIMTIMMLTIMTTTKMTIMSLRWFV